MMGAFIAIVERAGFLRLPFATALGRARGLPRSAWGTALAHFALGVILLGIICETQWAVERVEQLTPGQSIAIADYDLAFDGLSTRPGSNYEDLVAHFTVRRGGELIGTMQPAKRSFPSRATTVNESALLTRGFSQLYLAIGDVQPGSSTAVRLYYKPLVLLIWLGALIMAFGGALSLSDRRLRVGAPVPARTRAVLAPAE
jgi:cytochrome c-type biogenesis protein CcmF